MNFTLESKDVRFQLSIWKDFAEKIRAKHLSIGKIACVHSGYEQMKFKHDKAMQ